MMSQLFLHEALDHVFNIIVTVKTHNFNNIFDFLFLQEDVEAFMAKPENESVEAVLSRLNEQHQKYKFMELNLNTKKKRLFVENFKRNQHQ